MLRNFYFLLMAAGAVLRRLPPLSKRRRHAMRREAEARRKEARAAINERDYATAGRILRGLCRSPFAQPSDFRNRAGVLHLAGRSSVVDRYRARLEAVVVRERGFPLEVALRLWACDASREALDLLEKFPRPFRERHWRYLTDLCKNELSTGASIHPYRLRYAAETRDYGALEVTLRKLSRARLLNSESLVQKRVQALHQLGKSDVVRRYSRWMRHLGKRPGHRTREIALRLWACGEFTIALGLLAGLEDKPARRIALRCLVAKRFFPAAETLLAEEPDLEPEAPVVETIALVVGTARRAGFDLPRDCDIASVFVEHWISAAFAQPAASYTPLPGTVLIYSHSLAIGGAERQVRNLLEGLCLDPDIAGVTLLLKEARARAEFSLGEGAARTEVMALGSFAEGEFSLAAGAALDEQVRALSRVLGLNALPQLLAAIQQIRPEVVHVRGGLHAEVALAGLLSGVPRILVHFGSMTRGQQSTGTEVARLRESLVERVLALCAGTGRVILAANSRAAADDWAAACGLPARSIDVIPNAISAPELGFGALGDRVVGESAHPVVGGVFRIAAVKDPLLWVDVARRVAAEIPGVRFLVVGDGPMRAAMEQAISAAGLAARFEMPGFVTAGLAGYLARMDVFLTTTRTESLPNAIIEAQLAGLPVIAPDVGGIAEAVAGPGTARITARDAESLAGQVVAALRDVEWRREVAKQAPVIISRRFSPEALVQRVKAAYGWQYRLCRAAETRDYGALEVTLRKSPAARLPNPESLVQKRIRALHQLGKSHVVSRYARLLRHLGKRPGGCAREIALRLWACGEFSASLELLVDLEDRSARRTALRCLVAKRFLPAAAALLDEARDVGPDARLAEVIGLAVRTARQAGIELPPDRDVAPAFVEHWIAEAGARPAASYAPVSGTVLLYSHSLAIGGAERQTRNLIEGLCLEPEVARVTLLLKETGARSEFGLGQGAAPAPAEVMALGSFAEGEFSLAAGAALDEQVRALSRVLGLNALPQLLAAIQHIRPEVVHVRGGLHAEVALAGLLAGVPRILVHFGSMTRGQQSTGTEAARLRESLVERVLALCAGTGRVTFGAVSRAAADDWETACGLPAGFIGVIPNAVNARELGFDGLGDRAVGASAHPVVGGVFRIAAVKDPLLWVEVARSVAAEVPGVRFLVVGDGPMRAAMEQAISAAGLADRFEMPGFVTEGLAGYLGRMDVFLLTTRTEGLSNAIIEAQLAGLPVIAPDVGGISEAIAGPELARITDRDAGRLAGQVVAALRDVEWRREVAKRAPAIIAARFSPEALVQRVKLAYALQFMDAGS